MATPVLVVVVHAPLLIVRLLTPARLSLEKGDIELRSSILASLASALGPCLAIWLGLRRSIGIRMHEKATGIGVQSTTSAL